MLDISLAFIRWYLVVQIISLSAVPLTLRLFTNLPDRGYAFSKSLGILLVGLLLWWGTFFGLLRNEFGGALLALLVFGSVSLVAGWPLLRHGLRPRLSLRVVVATELLFLVAFALWTLVRAYDPAINHTEQPMDLMFMNGIWTSESYPPRDPWLSGYAISYYYLGYWLLLTVARLAGEQPEFAYNLGQACWFGFLCIGTFGVGYNLLALGSDEDAEGATHRVTAFSGIGLAGGLLTTIAVALTGNLHALIEWLYAQGVAVERLAAWAQVPNFPDAARVSKVWYIDAGWSWWWRASRVLGDRDLMGNHIEVIDEFPMFSYVLGDNHPHVLAMPFVLLAVALALAIFVGAPTTIAADRETGPRSFGPESILASLRLIVSLAPMGLWGAALVAIATGALVFLNTWDFPPYWALLTLVVLFGGVARTRTLGRGIWIAVLFAALLLVATAVLYLPYFVTAQSQAGGIVPNFYHPTRLPQFLLMFGPQLLGTGALLAIAWREAAPRLSTVGASVAAAVVLPAVFLGATLWYSAATESSTLTRMALPSTYASHVEAALDRWSSQPYTFLLVATLLGLAFALLWRRLTDFVSVQNGAAPGVQHEPRGRPITTFALMLAFLGLLLIFAPEFVYLRDNFGTRMNTVFKFYYQGWLLLGTGSSYAIVLGLSRLRTPDQRSWGALALGTTALLLILSALIYPVAGARAKILGFGAPQPTLNGLAYLGADEQSAIQWIRRNAPEDAVVLQSKGRSYWASDNRINAATGRATLLGWDGHEAQWRGEDFGQMAAGRPELIQAIYSGAPASALPELLAAQQIDFVVVGPVEREQYDLSPAAEARFQEALDLVFEQGSIRIYRRRG